MWQVYAKIKGQTITQYSLRPIIIADNVSHRDGIRNRQKDVLLMQTRLKMPNLSNATASGIVDMCAPDQEELNRLDKLTKYYKTGLKARLRDDMKTDPFTYLVTGEKYSATITDGEQVRVDMDKVRELLTQEQIDSCMKVISMQTVRFFKNAAPTGSKE